MQPNKRNVLAIVAHMIAKKKSPTLEQVQQLKLQPRVSMDDAITHFMPKINARQRQQFIFAGNEYAKKFKRLDDAGLRTERPDLHTMWLGNGTAEPVHSGGNKGGTYNIKLSELTTRDALLARLNLLRKKQGLSPETSKKLNVTQLKERIAKLEQVIIKESVPPFKVLPPAVAEGAYRSDLEAQHKTGFTTNGKSKSQEKHERRVEKHIEKRVVLPGTNQQQVAKAQGKVLEDTTKAVAAGSVVTLADIARELDIIPKVARQKARKHANEIRKLEFNKQKYKFAIKDKSKVIAILRGDA